jgi:DNA-binding NtrC family response regulator
MTTPRTLLIVDDDPSTRRSLIRTLSDPEYRILQAESAEGAFAILDRGEVQVVLSDYHMGGIDGVTFLSQLEQRYPKTVRLLLTSDMSTDVMIDAVNEGRARRVIYKPWHDEQLRAVVRQCLGLPRAPVQRPAVYRLEPMGKATVDRLAAMLGVDIRRD